MIKIALGLKKEVTEYVKRGLSKKDFNFNISGFGTLWIYDIGHIDYIGESIRICHNKSFEFYDIYLKDIEYFEIYNQ